MREITLRIKNDQLAENLIALIGRIKEIEIFEDKKNISESAFDEILESSYDLKEFEVHNREDIYERAGVHLK